MPEDEFREFVKKLFTEEPELTIKLIQMSKRLSDLAKRYDIPADELEPIITDFVNLSTDIASIELKSFLQHAKASAKKKMGEVV